MQHALYIILTAVGLIAGFPASALSDSFLHSSIDAMTVATTNVTTKGPRFDRVDPATGQRFHIETMSQTTQPIGHYEFCQVHPLECGRNDYQEPEYLSKKLWAEVQKINQDVNDRIRPLTDYQNHGKEEQWDYAVDDTGDCEDYVLVKRRELMQLGVSPSNLLITVVRESNGAGHAVLTFRTRKFELILDNLTDKVHIWYETSYRFLKRQMPQHSGLWEALNDTRSNIYTASVK